MKSGFGMLRHDCARAFLSWRFCFACLGVAILMFAGAYSDLIMESSGNVLYYFMVSRTANLFNMGFALLFVFPYSAALFEDYDHKYIRVATLRAGKLKYLTSKYCVGFLSGFMAYAVGSLLFLIPVWIKCGFQIGTEPVDVGLWAADLVAARGGVSYILVQTLITGISAGFWAVLGLFLSVYIRNRYLVLLLPFIIFYALREIQLILYMPSYTRYASMIFGRSGLPTAELTVLAAVGLYIGTSMILFAVNYSSLKAGRCYD